MGVTVCSERSSCPCLCSGVGYKAGITSGRLMKFSRYVPHKRKIPPTQRSDDFVGWIGGKMNRVCCGTVRSFRGDYPLKVVVITVRTTTFSKIWNKGYHGSVGASRWFCKIYCGKAVVVGLICVVCSKSHIVTICFFAIYGWREGEALNLRRKALVFPLRWHRLALVDRGR